MFEAQLVKFEFNPNFTAKVQSSINEFNPSQNYLTPDEPLTKRIWFGVPIGIQSFCGRQEFLQELHKILQQDSSESSTTVTILSQLKVITGLGGIGKTQTALKYISEFENFYEHVIWIQAETQTTLKNSFLKLAAEIKIPCKNSGDYPEEFDNIVRNIYKKLCAGEKSTLFVFDNADDFTSGIEQFLPSTVDPELKNLAILVTSRNQDWSRRFEKFQVLPLDLLTNEESLNFILEQLNIPDCPESREETREFMELMGGLPLALQQSLAYIKEKRNLTGQFYNFSDYINEFKSATGNILDYNKIPGSSSTILVTWNVTFEKIKNLENGKSSIEIIQVLSLLYADKIPVTFIQSLFHRLQESEIFNSLALLEKYSLVKREFLDNGEMFVTIHRQLQFVIVQNLKNSKSAKKIFDNVLEKLQITLKKTTFAKNIPSVFDFVLKRCLVILKTINLAKSSDIFINMHQLVENPFNFIPITEKFLEFMQEFADALLSAGRYSESLNLCTKVYNHLRDIFGENHVKTLIIQQNMAKRLYELGKFGESLNLCEDVLEKMGAHRQLGWQHPLTLNTKCDIARILNHQKKHSESLRLLQGVLKEMKKSLGENHPSTLKTQGVLASVYFEQGEHETALKLCEDVEKKQVEILGVDHPLTLISTHNKAIVLFKMGKDKEAAKLFHDVYGRQREILGGNHPNTLNTLVRIAAVVEREGKLEEALELKQRVLEGRRSVLGDDHRDTKISERNIQYMIQKMSLNNDNSTP